MNTVQTMAEWRAIELRDVTLNSEDRALATLLQVEGKVGIDELRDAVRVRSFSWVGVVRFSQFELRITPKLAGGYAGLLEMLEYVAGIDVLRRLPTPPANLLHGESNLLDLLALLLSEEVERIIRRGLLADYREQEEDLPVVRGRLLADLQILRHFGRVDRLECRFDAHLTDIPENQILAAALGECRGRVRNTNVRRRIRRLCTLFETECSLEGISLPTIRGSLAYHRLNAAYRDAHQLAWIILDALGIEDIYQAGNIRCFGFLLDMNTLFEAFVSKWLTQILEETPLRVFAQRRDYSVLWDATRDRPYAAVIPDLLIENPRTRRHLPVDAKYKTYDARTLDSVDLYQTFLYAFAYGSSDGVLPRALVFYPASTPTGEDVQLQVRRVDGFVGGEISVLRLHVSTALEELRSRRLSPRTLDLRDRIQRSVPEIAGMSGSLVAT